MWISGRPLSNLECLLYDERDEKNSCCRDGPGRPIVGVNLCLVRRLFSRLFTPPRQCRRSRVRPADSARGTRGLHIYVKETCDLFAFLLSEDVIEICRAISFVEGGRADGRKLWMDGFFGCLLLSMKRGRNGHRDIIGNLPFF